MFKIKLLLFIVFFNSCQDVKKAPNIKSINDSLVGFKFSTPTKLVSISLEYRIKNNIFNWLEFTDFVQSFESLIKLNPEGIQVFLEDIELKAKALKKSKYPEHLDIPDIKSRLKVVQTMILQSKFYSQNKQWENLDLSLQNLYLSYNSFISRIKSVNDEVNLFAN